MVSQSSDFPPAGQVTPPDVLTTHQAWVKAQKEIAGLMLMTMDPDIQKNLEHLGAYDMLKELKTLKDPKNQKKKSHKAAKGNQGKGKAKMGYAPVQAPTYASKPKNPPTSKKDNPTKDAICHQCGEVGHWRRNCPIYLAELMEKKRLSQGASTSGIFTIELYSFPSASWVYDTGYGTHICITTQGLKGSRKLKPGALSLIVVLDTLTRKALEKLQHDGLLESTDIKSFEKYVACMSGKMARKPYSHKVKRAKDLLGLIHTDVCGPFKIMSRQGASYFCFKRKYGKTIKSLRSDHGGEYMCQEFLDHLKDHEIISHRTPPYTPQHNGVFERRNRTLLDMVQSMMSQNTLPKSFWNYALESAAHILNIVPTKKVEKTPYEIWHGQALKISYLKFSGCEALVKRDTLTKPDKLEPRSIKCIFVGYPKETMGYSFYYPPKNKVFVAQNDEFLEKSLIAQEASGSLKDLEIIQEEDTHPSIDTSLNREEDDQEIDEPHRLCLYIDAEKHELGDLGEPANYKAALLDPESEKWPNAMNVEMQSMKDNKLWELVDLPPNGKTPIKLVGVMS
ncbi:retrotransposon protein, putative, ty1-copia subclass [Tanacetum coccineum]